MRGVLAVLLIAGCEGVPEVPVRLEPLVTIPQTFQDTPAAFDAEDRLLIMDGSSLRRLEGTRLDVVPSSQQFSFGAFGVDRDGTVLVGSNNTFVLARFEANDTFTLITPAVPSSFARPIGTPSGAYHVVVPSFANTLALPAGTDIWVDSMRRLDRTLRAPDGTIYAVEDGDIVKLAADDSAVPVASCSELAGGICLDLELAGTDADGHIHIGIKSTSGVHVLDPVAGTYRHRELPGGLRVESLTAGAAMTVVIALDPERGNERSLWALLPGADRLLRFATLEETFSFIPPKVLSDRSGNAYLIADTQVSVVVPN